MANPYRGEVVLTVNGVPRAMRLTLGALAALEARLESGSLLDMISRFETGSFRVRDLVSLLSAGLSGGGHPTTDEELLQCDIAGGPVAAAEAAARLLKLTFTLPGGDVE